MGSWVGTESPSEASREETYSLVFEWSAALSAALMAARIFPMDFWTARGSLVVFPFPLPREEFAFPLDLSLPPLDRTIVCTKQAKNTS